jgi:hypothetical protein
MAVPGAKPRTLFPYCWLTGPPAASGSLAKRNRRRHETGGPSLCSQGPPAMRGRYSFGSSQLVSPRIMQARHLVFFAQ